MVFIETPLFTRQLQQWIDDDAYAQFQAMLMRNPAVGDIIQGTGGLRKIRLALPGRGKSGGARVIYYWFNDRDQIGLLMLYPKNTQDDLSAEQCKALQNIIQRWKYHGKTNI